MQKINIIGGGLAGVEAAHFLANKGYKVTIYERRPKVKSPAHHTDYLAELVCSNSLKNNSLENACGLLKEEMRHLGSLTMKIAEETKVPSGNALSVDRDEFARKITENIQQNPNIFIKYEEISKPLEGINIIATGPLTSEGLMTYLKEKCGSDSLFFFDASAPIVKKESIDFSKAYYKSRYGQGDNSYINCPFSREEYFKFYNELINAKVTLVHDFDKNYFEGCMPIEVLAKRGIDTLRYGPLKPKGLQDLSKPKAYAILQLRQDNLFGDLYNIVGFQTNLTYGEQKRVFSLIPGLENAEFVRYGLMHRNSYLKSPSVLNNSLITKFDKNIIIAGQLCGVEGYVESAATGIIAGIQVMELIENKEVKNPPLTTMIGCLIHYITNANPDSFEPMNANFAIMDGATKDNRLEMAERSLKDIDDWKNTL